MDLPLNFAEAVLIAHRRERGQETQGESSKWLPQ
ncbi:hypothetical protein PMI09_04727 [Rhizobium sp. CF122]|nr:hypothetical protein PMI09_04727 [Rhizobium sp. CF122]MBB3396512.1 hypothetical protein [Rhizobium sp. BK060]MBB4170258.1 hypothetical protein [Rhizobium sp. BK538]TCM76250.1 hypothetical protein EV291_11043 [Rhizobium sp. BK068]